jgi:hypothetical protein
MLKYHDIQQNDPGWYLMRSGKITGSKIKDIMANYGKAFGNPAKQYAVNIAIEQITGEPIPSEYSNSHMERGHEKEPLARALYEAQTFSGRIDNGGFFCNDWLGCSPDGLIDWCPETKKHRGGLEVKSAIPSVHYERVKRQDLDPTHKWQCIGNMKFAGLEWLDFVSFCDAFPPDKQLYIYRYYPGNFKEEYQMIDLRLAEFRALIEETKQTILNSEYSL